MTTSPTGPRYVPILKGRRGEFDALRDLALATRQRTYPLVEILPTPDPEKQDVLADCMKALGRLVLQWSTEPLMLDIGYFDLETDSRPTPLGIVMDAARSMVVAIPVLRLSDSDAVLADAASAAEEDNRGIAVRIIGEDLDEDPDDLSAALVRLADRVGVTIREVDLVLDLGALQGDVAVVGGSRLVLSLLRGLSDLVDFRSVTVASGAFPLDLSGVAPWTLGERSRDDAALWTRVVGRSLRRIPDYGDYAVAHPMLTTGVPVSPPPQLRYTVADRWLILKSSRNDPRGHDQFYDICDVIARHQDFSGAELGIADQRIANSRSQGPGNATTWRTIGTTHHADLVVARLTTLGEP